MKKEYDTSVKEAIERVMSVFSEYIKTTPYFDIVWSGRHRIRACSSGYAQNS